MTEPTRLLHNMSAPPKSVVSYAGLSRASIEAVTPDNGGRKSRVAADSVYGIPAAFWIPDPLRKCGPVKILQQLGEEPGLDAEKELVALIEKRTEELPLPNACVVVPNKPAHGCPWADPLAALAVITKSSATVWLRSKSPRLSLIGTRQAVSLLVPPTFADRMEAAS